MDADNSKVSTNKAQHKLLLLKLSGNLTGDLWHFAAAIALYQAVQTPLIEATPVTSVAVIEYTWIVDEVKKEEAKKIDDKEKRKIELAKTGKYGLSHYLKRGIVSFDYLRSIGTPAVLMRLAQMSTTGNIDVEAYTKASGQHALRLLTVLIENSQASWGTIYSKTKETDFEFKPEVEPKFPKANGTELDDFLSRYPKRDIPKIIGLDDIKNKLGNKPELILYNDKRGEDGPFVATAITMMYLADPKTRRERVEILQRQLSGDPSGEWWIQANNLKKRLSAIYNLTPGKKILLFNYRLGDVNRQHDSNLDLLKQVSGIATSLNMVCVPVFVSVTDGEAAEVKKICGDSFIELYARDVHYDKRYTAAFWTLVARELTTQVFGLIGGRSGSMDIASFMGVNSCQWDEPLCDPKSFESYSPSYANQNVDQCLRLFNQIYITSIVYLDPKNKTTFESAHGNFERMTERSKLNNCYTRLIEGGLMAWLKRPSDITEKTVYPSFTLADPDMDGRKLVNIDIYPNPSAFRNLVTGTFDKIENAEAKVRAEALRGMGFEPVLLEKVDKSQLKPLAQDQKPDPEQEKLRKEAHNKEREARAKAHREANAKALQTVKQEVAKEELPETSTLVQVVNRVQPDEALSMMMGMNDSEDAGDVVNMDMFTNK